MVQQGAARRPQFNRGPVVCQCGVRFDPTGGFTRDDTKENPNRMEIDDYKITKTQLLVLSDLSLALGFASIVASVIAWFARKKDDPAGGERTGIFIGLWVPSFFILSNRIARKAEELEE